MIFALWILIAVICLSFAVLIAVSAYFIHFMTKPKLMTEEKSISDEISNGTWKTLDDLPTEDWNVITRDGYLLHGTIIYSVPVSSGHCTLSSQHCTMSSRTCFGISHWVIITHGWTNRRTETHKYVHMFHNLGFNCYIYDLRNHGVNKKSWTSMGPIESRDIIDIAAALRSRFGSDISIGLHGESLGSASSVLALGLADKTPCHPDTIPCHPELDSGSQMLNQVQHDNASYQHDNATRQHADGVHFSFLISDCGYASLKDLMIDLCTRLYHLPPIFAHAASNLNVLLHGYRLFSVEPYKALEHTTTPVLFIHGAADDFIIPSNAQKMFCTLSAQGASTTLSHPELTHRTPEPTLRIPGPTPCHPDTAPCHPDTAPCHAELVSGSQMLNQVQHDTIRQSPSVTPKTELYLCPGANHALSYATNPTEYEKQVAAFLSALQILNVH